MNCLYLNLLSPLVIKGAFLWKGQPNSLLRTSPAVMATARRRTQWHGEGESEWSWGLLQTGGWGWPCSNPLLCVYSALVGRPLITALTTACEELSAAADDKHTQQHAGNSEQTWAATRTRGWGKNNNRNNRQRSNALHTRVKHTATKREFVGGFPPGPAWTMT